MRELQNVYGEMESKDQFILVQNNFKIHAEFNRICNFPEHFEDLLYPWVSIFFHQNKIFNFISHELLEVQCYMTILILTSDVLINTITLTGGI